MTKAPFLLVPLIALTACASPRDRCIAGANRPVATIDRLLAVTQGNIQRGFGLTEVQDVRVLRRTCEGENEDGSTFRFPCEKTETVTRQEPVSINIADEQIKLQQLRERRAQVVRQAQAQTQQCLARYVE